MTEFLNRLGKRFAGRVSHQTQEAAKNLEGVCGPILGKASAEHPGIVFRAGLAFLRLKNADAAAEIDRHMAGYKLLKVILPKNERREGRFSVLIRRRTHNFRIAGY